MIHSRVGQKSQHPFSLTNLETTRINLSVVGQHSLKFPFGFSRNIKTIQKGRESIRKPTLSITQGSNAKGGCASIIHFKILGGKLCVIKQKTL